MTTKSNVYEFTDANFETEVLRSEVPVLVDFWAEWCMPCKMLSPTIDEIADQFDGKIRVGKVDTDANRDTSIQYSVQAIPTVLLFSNGEVVHKFVGLKNKTEFEEAINAILD